MMRRLTLALALTLTPLTPLHAQEESAQEEPERDPHAEIERALAERQVTLNFDGTPLDEVLGFFQDIAGLNMVAHPEADLAAAQVSLRLRDISLGSAVKLALAADEDLTYTLWCGALVVHEAARKLPAPPVVGEEAGEVGEKLREQTVTLNLPDTPLRDAIGFLRDISGLNVVLGPAVRREGLDEEPIALRARDMRLVDALCHTTLLYGLTWRLEDGAIVIDVAEDAHEGDADDR